MTWQYGNPYALRSRMPRVVRILLFACIASYFAQLLLDGVTSGSFSAIFGLSAAGLSHGYVWQLVSYMFLHGGVLHLLLNMLVLYFMGPETERGMGTRHFLILYFLSGILGGLGWVLISRVGLCVGASGAIFGILGAFAALYPHRPITLLLFFVLPVTMKAWVLVLGLAVVQILLLLTGEGGNIAYAVHVGGVVAGYLYATIVFRRPDLARRWRRAPRLRVLRGGERSATSGQIDRILDKIAERGIGSLTRQERDMLEQASRERRS